MKSKYFKRTLLVLLVIYMCSSAFYMFTEFGLEKFDAVAASVAFLFSVGFIIFIECLKHGYTFRYLKSKLWAFIKDW